MPRPHNIVAPGSFTDCTSNPRWVQLGTYSSSKLTQYNYTITIARNVWREVMTVVAGEVMLAVLVMAVNNDNAVI